MFKSTMRKGFHMTFKNGWTISVQWGAGNYCENRDNFDFSSPMAVFDKDMKSEDAEIAIFDNKGNYADLYQLLPNHHTDGMVCGWLSADEVADIILIVKNANPC